MADQDRSSDINPYEVTQVYHPPVEKAHSPGEVDLSPVLKSVLVWTGICSLSAAPSFYLGFVSVAREQALAMIVGVLIFIGLYTFADLYTRTKSFRKNVRVRGFLRATFVVRSLMVVVFPAAVFVDMMLGLASVSMVGSVAQAFGTMTNDQMGFGLALITTLVQGTLLSFFLVVLGIMLWIVVSLVLLAAKGIHSLASRA